jgi:hypothetical protein
VLGQLNEVNTKMGYMRHHAIIVTASDYGLAHEALKAAHDKATQLECLVTPITDKGHNGYQSFLVAPDGSKEGWEESESGDHRRADLIKFMMTYRYEDGSSPLEWVEVQFGDDDWETRIVNDSDAEHRKKQRARRLKP